MTREQANVMMQDLFDDDSISDALLEELFTSLYDRAPDGEDRDVGLWSLCCAASSGQCSCLTRREHDEGGCLSLDVEGYIGVQRWKLGNDMHGQNVALPIGAPNNAYAFLEEEDPDAYKALRVALEAHSEGSHHRQACLLWDCPEMEMQEHEEAW